jgi:hypothetical protein
MNVLHRSMLAKPNALPLLVDTEVSRRLSTCSGQLVSDPQSNGEPGQWSRPATADYFSLHRTLKRRRLVTKVFSWRQKTLWPARAGSRGFFSVLPKESSLDEELVPALSRSKLKFALALLKPGHADDAKLGAEFGLPSSAWISAFSGVKEQGLVRGRDGCDKGMYMYNTGR